MSYMHYINQLACDLWWVLSILWLLSTSVLFKTWLFNTWNVFYNRTLQDLKHSIYKLWILFSNCLACSLHFQHGLNLCETRLCSSLARSVDFDLTHECWLAGVINLLHGWSFTSGQEMHSACFQWSEGDRLTNCSLLECVTLLTGSPNWFDGSVWETDAIFLCIFFDLARRFWNQCWKKKATL